jgi:hypothetical protein
MKKHTKSTGRVNARAHSTTKQPKVDWRKQLYNDCKLGPIDEVQLPEAMITRLHGILLDIDPRLYRKSAVPPGSGDNPRLFNSKVVQQWLGRHAALRDAEVLNSGRGLHIIISFAAPVEFATEGERQRWAGIVKAIQAVLPSDPDMPGITALTRARGSINSKNGTKVTQLAPGKPVIKDLVLELFDQLRAKPFRTAMSILFGSERSTPCPVCDRDDSTLSAQDHVGLCYGSCGRGHRPRPPPPEAAKCLPGIVERHLNAPSE